MSDELRDLDPVIKQEMLERVREIKAQNPGRGYVFVQNKIKEEYDFQLSDTQTKRWMSDRYHIDYTEEITKRQAIDLAFHLKQLGKSAREIRGAIKEELDLDVSIHTIGTWVLGSNKQGGVQESIREIAKEELSTNIVASKERVNVYEEIENVIKMCNSRFNKLELEEERQDKLKNKDFGIIARILLAAVEKLSDLRGETPAQRHDLVISSMNFKPAMIEELLRENGYVLPHNKSEEIEEIIEGEAIELLEDGEDRGDNSE